MKKAIPYLLIVKQFAFMVDVPFFTLRDMMRAVRLYEESLRIANTSL